MILPLVSLGLFLLGQIGRLSFNQQEVNVYLYEIPYFIWIVHSLFKQRTKLKLPKAAISLIGILLATFLFGIFSVSAYENAVSLMYLVRLSLYLVGFSLTIQHFLKKTISPIYLNVFFSLVGVIGVIQYFFYNNLRNLQYLGWDPHLSRVFGQFLDTSVAGAVYGLTLVFILFNQKLFPRAMKVLYAISYILLGFFTYSRGFFVSLFISTICYSLAIRRNLKAVLVVLALVVLFVVFSPKPFGEGVNLLRTSTIKSRTTDYEQGFKLWQKNPIIGVGYNRIRYFKEDPISLTTVSELRGASKNHAGASFHSSYLIILVTTGVFGFGAFVYWLWTVGKMSNFAMISMIFLGTYSLFDNILLHPFILFFWPVLIGVTSRSER